MNDPSSLLVSPEVSVQPDWVDAYGHMNMARYVGVFDELGYPLLDKLGVGSQYASHKKLGLFVVDTHVSYQREVLLGERVYVTLRVLGVDHVRLLTMLEMRLAACGGIAATIEQLAVNVSLESRAACRFQDSQVAVLQEWAQRHRMVPLPAGFKQLLKCSAKN